MSFILRALIIPLAAASTTYASVLQARSDEAIAGGYIPKTSLAIIALAMFVFSGLIHWIHFFRFRQQLFLITLTLGMTVMAVGFGIRIVFAHSPTAVGIYVIMDMCILLSPCAFLATDYMLLARLASTFDTEVSERCLLIRPSRLAKLFVCSDVITFFLQAAGGGLMSSVSSAKTGNKIIMLGLALQLASFAIFTAVLLLFGFRLRREFPQYWFPQKTALPFRIFSAAPIDDWRILFVVICITCTGILIRSIFRIAEFAGGFNGYITTHEAYFYLFDSLPLWISMTLYCIVWPKRCLSNSRADEANIALHAVKPQ
ncbi:RTA1 like protein-domain-containing protein [Mycena galericulata]|nr:RTA1 like protein-domain-containing protein [Mycena galericulata]